MDKSYGNRTTLLIGAIDTVEELELIIDTLWEKGYLKRRILNNEFPSVLNEFEQLKRDNVIRGPVDTEFELRILLRLLRNKRLLIGPIDTPEEIAIFMDRLREEDILPAKGQFFRPPGKKPKISSPSKRGGKDLDEYEWDENSDMPKPK